ncbi:hypothetical protein ACKFBN_21215, partial [Yersinia enterocolitica]
VTHSSRSPYSVEFGAQQYRYRVIGWYLAGVDWGFRLGSRGLAEYQVVYGYLGWASSRHRRRLQGFLPFCRQGSIGSGRGIDIKSGFLCFSSNNPASWSALENAFPALINAASRASISFITPPAFV